MSSSNNSIVGVHYKVGKKIGEGSFGIIFEGINILNNQQVAIKFEPRKCEAPQLRDEYRAYRILNGTKGIPQAYFFGQEGVHSILIIDLLGPSLEDLFDWCNRKFSIKTVIQVAKQMIERVQSIHENNLIYRDIKPDNFLIGKPDTPEANMVYIVDFGMAKQYRDPKTKVHIPYREKKALSGTARYMSINTHLGREQLRRDDLESLGHVFMYFLRGSLPWQGLKAPTNKQKYEKIGMKKQTTSINELCYGFPIQFAQYLTYVRNLKFDETPDYKYLINLMDKALLSVSVEEDGHFDWMDLNGGKGWDAALNKKANLHGYGNPHPPAHYRKQQQQQQQQQLQNSQNQPLLGRNHSRNNSASSPRNNNRFGYQSIQQQQQNQQQQPNQQDSRNIPFLNNNSRFTQQQYLQNGMIPVRDNEDLHSDTSSFNRKKNRSYLAWIFCCCY
ncbi:Casein kinase I 2 [Candida viswanathii]|uniref:non-specific serine/threonine protein kinase n=1 Tax=Candida viswanathii TaxID=5486 RepID=A0A367XQE9_9ASCO|nr:Casein kinase I 2 [Candida viswanathii]